MRKHMASMLGKTKTASLFFLTFFLDVENLDVEHELTLAATLFFGLDHVGRRSEKKTCLRLRGGRCLVLLFGSRVGGLAGAVCWTWETFGRH